ncbi:hypothetical protein C8J56DRAFT_777715 [Mycena floridula]|nr:hypothetical protein C8J56DRAFT_777715 [Mycena floridula]
MDVVSDRPDLPADTLYMERAGLVGDCVSFIAFGVLSLLTMQTLYALIKYPRVRGENIRWHLVVFTSVTFIFAFTFVTIQIQGLQFMFIDHREHVGGPLGYALIHYDDWRNILGYTVGIAPGWFADGLFLYRCIIVFQLKLYILALPILLYLATLSKLFLGSLFLYAGTKAGSSLFAHLTVGFGVPYFTISAALNFLITTLITTRLLRARWHLTRANVATSDNSYVSISAMIIESSMLYAVISICFVIPFGLNNHVASIFLPLQGLAPVISSTLLIFRVARRRAWEHHAFEKAISSTLVFGDSEATQGSRASDTGEWKDVENIQLDVTF